MLAYHSDPAIKSNILRRLRRHAADDAIVKGQYWQDGKGCAVGCTIHSRNHVEYETRFGIPQALARLEDAIFEGLPNNKAKEWPLRFMRAIRTGANLSRVSWKFLHWTLTDEKVNPGIAHPLVAAAVKQCADITWTLACGGTVTAESAWSARSAAESAAASARSAAASAASARSARSAAESAWSAWSAASAESARSAAASAWSAWSARSARSAAESAAASARSAAYARMADKLIELLEAA